MAAGPVGNDNNHEVIFMTGESLRSSFPNAWRSVWRWSFVYWITLFAMWGYPVIWEVFVGSILSLRYLTGWLFTVFIFAIPATQLCGFRCPRCNHRFVSGLGLGIFSQSYCAHCGLAKFSEDVDESEFSHKDRADD